MMEHPYFPFYGYFQWWIQGCTQDTGPSWSKLFNFMEFVRRNGWNNTLAPPPLGLAPPVWEILVPPLTLLLQTWIGFIGLHPVFLDVLITLSLCWKASFVFLTWKGVSSYNCNSPCEMIDHQLVFMIYFFFHKKNICFQGLSFLYIFSLCWKDSGILKLKSLHLFPWPGQ